ncbi:MAG TPA: hypothetical protein VN748_22445 [Pseudonocardiaceae bacterium]|jgi:hypothetical protein|nr:hypothetical protein [Pseudonocardiaceae bacterium]
MDTAVIADLSKKMTAFLETGTVPEGLFHPDALLDVSLPTWRIRSRGLENLIGVRKDSHPCPGKVTPTRLDPMPNGFMLEFEERWEHDGQHWYCREMLRADVSDGRISELTVYCTGDWDEGRQQEYAHSTGHSTEGTA